METVPDARAARPGANRTGNGLPPMMEVIDRQTRLSGPDHLAEINIWEILHSDMANMCFRQAFFATSSGHPNYRYTIYRNRGIGVVMDEDMAIPARR
ncbi:hypothetical protein [Burkholderia sp. PU8-34]